MSVASESCGGGGACLMGIVRTLVVIAAFLAFAGEHNAHAAELVLFAGAASKPATAELVERFESETGHTVRIHFGNSGNVLFQMKIAGRGDIYFPGSPNFMDQAEREGLIIHETRRIVAYLVPSINVQRGNPKKIKGLNDLTRGDIKVAIGNPRTVIVGTFAVEIFEHAHLATEIRPRIVGYTESCAKTANLLAMKSVDAIVGWRVQESWNPDNIETVLFPPDQIPRISYMPIAVSTFSENVELATRFIDYASSEKGKKIFEKWGYLTREEDARTYAPDAIISGDYILPEGW